MCRLIVAILFFLILKQAFAADDPAGCGNVTLDISKLGQPRNQSDVGWCYAFAAADMASFYLGQRVSAVDVAAKYNSRNPVTGYISTDTDLSGSSSSFSETSNVIAGGFVGSAIVQANERGFCNESLVRSPEFQGTKNLDQKLSSYTTNIYKLNRALRGEDGPLTMRICENGKASLSAIFPSTNLGDLIRVLKKYDSDSSWGKMTDLACMGKRKFLPKNLSIHVNNNTKDPSSMISDIDRKLNSRDIVGIGYDYVHLVRDSTTNWFVNFFTPRMPAGGHASTVVARRFNSATKECEYEIRGSNGAYCDPHFTKDQCANGYYWVNRANLKNNLISVDYLQKN